MPKLPRVTQKIFAKNAAVNDIGQFGSALSGTKVPTGNIADIQATAAFETGWRAAVISNRNYPTLQEMNGVQKVFSQQLAYTLQEGIPEYDAGTTYYKGSVVKSLDEQSIPVLFFSLIDENLGNPLTDITKWQKVSFGGGSGLEVCDIGMSLYVDETKGLRRYLNGQIVDINANTQVFLNRLKEITTLYPSLLCTEDEWQTAKTMSAFGQVGKFVFNYTDSNITSVRIPAIVNIQGLFDLQNLGLTVEAGLPNITGAFESSDRNHVTNGAFYQTTGAQARGDQNGNTGYWINFNASRSSSVYGKSDTVQPEAIQYPYFIQIATGSETDNNIINEIELNNPFSLFDSKYSDHELNNLSWLKSEGQWNAKAVYPSAYDELLREYNSPDRLATFNKDAFTVVGSPTITDDGVASGFALNSYITFQDLNLENANTWEIEGVVKTVASGTTDGTWLSVASGNGIMLPCAISKAGGDVEYQLYLSSTSSSWDISANRNITFPSGHTVKCNLKFTGTQYIYTCTDLDTNTVKTVTINSTAKIYQSPTRLGVKKNITYYQGSIDLKQFSITVDGQRVFSGANSMVKLNTEDYTDYDFVLNTAEETFRLPLLDGSETLPTGEIISQSIPSTGNSYYAIDYNCFVTIRLNDCTHCRLWDNTQDRETWTQTVDAGYQGKTLFMPKGHQLGLYYADGTMTKFTYQKAKGNGSLYFYVGETVQNANLIDAGRIGESLANKVDLSNTRWATNACMPDYSAGVALANGSAAPESGLLVLRTGSMNTATPAYLFVNGTRALRSQINNQPFDLDTVTLVAKGDIVTFSGLGASGSVTFYPLKGAN